MKRSEAREQAFTLVFERSFKDEDIDEIIEQAVIGRNLQVDDYAYSLAKEVSDHLPWLDEIIASHSKKWKINRMSRVALSILRMSLWEIDHMDTVPVGASINEAVELAKKYGDADDFSFVNGVLGAYVRAKGGSVPETEAPAREEAEAPPEGGAEAGKAPGDEAPAAPVGAE